MKKTLIIGLLIVVVLISGCYGEPKTGTPNTTSQPGRPNTVEIKDFTFVPGTITVPKGTAVTWINKDSAPHTVTGEGFSSDSLSQGQPYSNTFNQPGTYEYKCTIHPSMPHGKVVVT